VGKISGQRVPHLENRRIESCLLVLNPAPGWGVGGGGGGGGQGGMFVTATTVAPIWLRTDATTAEGWWRRRRRREAAGA
jgi:hypothetical protein